MALSEKALANKVQYNIDYNKKHYKRIPLDVTFSKYEEIKTAADSTGESVNGFIKSAIDKKLSDIMDNSENK